MRTTKQDFKKYQELCKKYQTEWGLEAWEMRFCHRYLDELYGGINIDRLNHVATHTLSTDWPDGMSKKDVDRELRETARHEMIHVIIGNVTELCKERYVEERELTQAEEELVRMLLRIIPN